MRTFRFLAVAVAAAALAGCSSAPSGPQFTKADVDAITKEVQALQEAFNAKDPDKVAALFAPTAAIMPPNQSTSRAREAVKQFYVGRFAEGATNLELETTDISGSGTLAYATGYYSVNLASADGGDPDRDRGKFLWIFRKLNDRWFIEYVTFNSDFAPKAPADEA